MTAAPLYIQPTDTELALAALPANGGQRLHNAVVEELRGLGLSEARAACALISLCSQGRARVWSDGTWRWAARKVG